MPDDRLEREINEILDKIEQFPTPENRRARARKRVLRRLAGSVAEAERAVARQLSRISIGQVMLFAFLMILGSFFFRRFSPLVTQWMLVGGVILFVSSFAIMIFSRGGSGPAGSQFWRGREVDPRAPSLMPRLRRWFASRRQRR
jgi:hypothetical protein